MRTITNITTLIILLAAMILNTSAASAYTDTEKCYAVEAVEACAEHGFMIGTAPDEFNPNEPLTRAQIITILWRMDGCPKSDQNALASAGYRGVDPNAWYFDALNWAYEHNIAIGSEWLMGPDDPMTREELATILYRHSEEEYRGTAVRYEDDAEISAWAQVPASWALMSGVFDCDDGYFNPGADVPRWNMAVIAMSYWDFLNYRAVEYK